MITITADKLIKCGHFRSREETRYYLNGVFVEPHDEGALLVATDGYCLVTWLDRKGKCTAPAIVALPRYLTDLCRPDRSLGPLFGERRRMVRVEDGTATVYDHVTDKWKPPYDVTIGTVADCIVDGTYPDWRRFTEDLSAKNEPAFFSAGYLGRFAKIAPKRESMQVVITGERSPARILMPAEPDFFGLVMPMVGNNRAIPAWMKIETAKKESGQ